MFMYPYFSAGDMDFFWKEQIRAFSWLPRLFHPEQGFGRPTLYILWLSYPYELVLKLGTTLGLSWFMIEKVLWAGFFFLAVYSSCRLARYIVGSGPVPFLASLIYVSNTYPLLLFAGGQLGVALAYSFAPLVILSFLKYIDQTDAKRTIRHQIQNGLVTAVLLMLDVRVFYLTAVVIGLYFLLRVRCTNARSWFHFFCSTFIVPLCLTVGYHAFWILPSLVVGNVAVPGEITSPGILHFLSFADFSHAVSLLHPNWPDNLFGKIYFLRPEFLVLPVCAFLSFLFTKHKSRLLAIFFGCVGLSGAFFAKGIQEPFGGIFRWMFIHVPGFVMFRDPTKFYLLIALAYSVLIPYAIEACSEWIADGLHCRRMNLQTVRTGCIVLFIGFWLFLIRDLFTGRVKGNFRPLTLTNDYIRFQQQLVGDAIPSRTLWIPRPDKFAFESATHPVLSSDDLFKDASISAIITLIQSPSFINTLRRSGVGYVIASEDPEHTMFLDNYTFDPSMRQRLIAALTDIQLKREAGFSALPIFESKHDPVSIHVPAYIDRQQYFADIGLVISGLTLCGSLAYLIWKRSGKLL